MSFDEARITLKIVECYQLIGNLLNAYNEISVIPEDRLDVSGLMKKARILLLNCQET